MLKSTKTSGLEKDLLILLIPSGNLGGWNGRESLGRDGDGVGVVGRG